MAAYGVKRYQISGPDWLGMQRYVIVATIRPGVTKEQVTQMPSGICWQTGLS